MPVPDFSPGEVLTAAAMDQIGLWKITASTTNSSAYVNFFNTLSSDFDNYKIILTSTATGANADITFQLATNTTPVAGVVYNSAGYRINYSSGTTVAGTRDMATSSWFIGRCSSSSPAFCTVDMELFNPFNTANTTFISSFIENEFLGQKFGKLDNTTSYNGFRIAVTAGWAGTVTLYGYRK